MQCRVCNPGGEADRLRESSLRLASEPRQQYRIERLTRWAARTAERVSTPRRAAAVGIFTPILFALALAGLTALQYDFLRSLGWHPVDNPSSGLPGALTAGPYGEVAAYAFVAAGVLLAFFQVGLHRGAVEEGGARGWRAGPLLLAAAGAATAAYGLSGGPADAAEPTVGEALRYAAAVVVYACFVGAAYFMWRRLRWALRWRWQARVSLLAGLLIIVSLFLDRYGFYLFIGTVLVWMELHALCLRNVSGRTRG